MEFPPASPPPPDVPTSPADRAPRQLPPPWILVVAAGGAILAGVLVAAIAQTLLGPPVSPSIGIASSPDPSAPLATTIAPDVAAASPSTAVPAGTPAPSASPAASEPAVSANRPTAPDLLPIKGSGLELGTDILMAADPDGGLWVLVPGRTGDIVTLLEPSGKTHRGWPVRLHGESCDQLLAAPDGSIRVVCSDPYVDDGLNGTSRRAFAFDRDARTMPGWPVRIDDGFTGRMVGDDLYVLVTPYAGDVIDESAQLAVHLLRIPTDGRALVGHDVAFPYEDTRLAIAPDGTAYASVGRREETAKTVTTEVSAFDLGGVRPGWPTMISGNTSELAFDAQGRAYVVVGTADSAPARTVVLGRDGRTLSSGSGDLAIVPTSTWTGPGGEDYPGPPIVADDGTTFLVSTDNDDTLVVTLDRAGKPAAGWPYRSRVAMAWTGYCSDGCAGFGQKRAPAVIGPGRVLYLLRASATGAKGGSIVAIRPSGRVRHGWPVTLRRPGSEFWSVSVATDGTVWALAIERESNGSSATILSIAPNGKVRWTRTIVDR